MIALSRKKQKVTPIHFLGLLFIFCLFLSPLMAQEFAFIYIDGNTGTNSIGQTWTNVGGGSVDDFTTGAISSNWNHTTTNVLTASNATAAGDYCVKYSLSFGADIAVWSVGVSVGGADPVEPIFVRSISNSRKDDGNVSGILMVSITSGQTVRLVVKANADNKDFTPSYAQLTICPAAQNPENYYAGMHIATSGTIAALPTTFTKITGFSAIPEINGWTFGSSDLTAGASSAGIYYISFSISFTGDSPETAPDLYTFELVKGGSSGTTHVLASRSTSQADIGNISGGGLVSISATDVLSILGKSVKSGDLTIHKATLSMFKLGDTTPNAIAAMKITSDESVTINTIDTWETIGTYTLINSNLWDFSSNVFTLNSTNAYGYYYLEFATSLSTTALSGGDDVELGVFVDDTQNSELTVSRRLSSSSDVGAVCGVGLFQADGPSTVTIKIRNTTSANNLTIKKSMVGFSQIRYVQSDTPLPISLNSFDVEQQGNAVKLSWQTASEVENLGYKIYRKVNDDMFTEISSYTYNDALRGQGTTTDIHDYEFIDTNVDPAIEYTYLLADISYQLDEIKHMDYIRTIYLPRGIKLEKVYPNPFNPQCTIPYILDINEHIRIDLLDISGKAVKTLVDKYHTSGNYYVSVNEPSLNSGLYFVRIQAGDQIKTQKIMMLK
jgi:Secretion system C-terminal sorting domain